VTVVDHQQPSWEGTYPENNFDEAREKDQWNEAAPTADLRFRDMPHDIYMQI